MKGDGPTTPLSVQVNERCLIYKYKSKSAQECTTHQQVNRKGAGKATSASSEHNCEDVDTSSAAKIEVVNVAKLFGRQEAKRSRWRAIVVTQWGSRWLGAQLDFLGLVR